MIGIDITVISRIENLVDKYETKYLNKFLTSSEIQLAKNNSTIAGFWAAKEAASKAIGTGIGKKCTFYDIKISKTKANAPKIKYSKRLRKKYNIKKSYLSITHDGGFAIAVVVNTTKTKEDFF